MAIYDTYMACYRKRDGPIIDSDWFLTYWSMYASNLSSYVPSDSLPVTLVAASSRGREDKGLSDGDEDLFLLSSLIISMLAFDPSLSLDWCSTTNMLAAKRYR